MTQCPICHLPLCSLCGRCPAIGHAETCPIAAQIRAARAVQDMLRAAKLAERAVGDVPTRSWWRRRG